MVCSVWFGVCISKYKMKFNYFYQFFKNEVDTNFTLKMESPWDDMRNLSGVTSHWLENTALLFCGR